MKLRNFKDDFIYFRIFGMLYEDTIIPFNIPLSISLNSTLRECINMIYNDEYIDSILKHYKNTSYSIIILMDQYGNSRSTSYHNILYYACKGVFYFSKTLKLYKMDLDLRKTIDPSLKSVTVYIDTNSIYYNDPSVIARKYFKKTCTDKELCNVLLDKNYIIQY